MSEIEREINERASAMVKSQKGENLPSSEKPVNLDSLQSDYLKKQVNDGKSLTDITSDFAKAKVTSDIIKNEDGEYDELHKELAEEQKETLKESFKQDRVTKQADTIKAKQKKAEAFYVSFRPILEFDFSHLIHKEQDKEVQPKQYQDRSYGIPLMVLMLLLFVVPYCGVSIILALLNGLNAIFEAIATFGKIARVMATSIFVIILLALIVYCALLGIDALFGTNIVGSIGFWYIGTH